MPAEKGREARSEGDDEEAPAAGEHSPHLERHEQKQAAQTKALPARVIHEVLREEGEAELKRSAGALLWSGLAGGLSMGFSFLTMSLLHSVLKGNPDEGLIAPLGYSIGFLIVILGKQQLFTETTLTATLPLMLHPTAKGFARLARMWALVLSANIVGTIAVAWLLSLPGVMKPEVAAALMATAKGAFGHAFLVDATRALFSGWLIALMVWMLPGSGSAAVFVIVFLTYVVGLGEFPHIIAGSTEAAYAVLQGAATPWDYVSKFFAPTLIGNLVGGTALAALLNHAPVAHDFATDKEGGETR